MPDPLSLRLLPSNLSLPLPSTLSPLLLLHPHLQQLPTTLQIILLPLDGRLELVEVFLDEGDFGVIEGEGFGAGLGGVVAMIGAVISGGP